MPSEHEGKRDRGKMGRRDFLARLGLGAAGAACAGSTGAQQPSEPDAAPRIKIAPDQQELDERRVRNQAVQAIRHKAKANGLNLVVVIADTFRLDHAGPYGSTYTKTPCLDEMARQSTVFENAFADGLPTIPARRVYHTGKSVLPGAAWIPHPAGQVNLAQILRAHGFWSGLVSDVYHYFAPDMNLHMGFDTWQWVRGQESDPYLGGAREQFQPKRHMPAELWNPDYDRAMRTYMMNTQHFQTEDDYFAAQTVRRVGPVAPAERHQQALHAVGGDVRSPRAVGRPAAVPEDVPRRLRLRAVPVRLRLPAAGPRTGRRSICAYLPVLRDLYAAEVTYVDHCIGRLLEAMEKMKLLDDTIVAFTTDHGTHLGEQGYVQKHPELLNSLVMHLPLIVRHPERSTAGKRVGGLVSAIDYAPTFCHLLGIDDQEQMDGRDAWDLVTGKADRLHDRVFTQFGNFASVRDQRWHYFQHVSGRTAAPARASTTCKRTRARRRNVIARHSQVAAELRERIADRLRQKWPGNRHGLLADRFGVPRVTARLAGGDSAASGGQHLVEACRAREKITCAIWPCGAGVPPAFPRAGETPAPQNIRQLIFSRALTCLRPGAEPADQGGVLPGLVAVAVVDADDHGVGGLDRRRTSPGTPAPRRAAARRRGS